MATTLSPEIATTFEANNTFWGLIKLPHLTAKMCKMVQLSTERLQLRLVHVAFHRHEEEQDVVLDEALLGDHPLRVTVFHHGSGREGRAGKRGEEGVDVALAPPLLVPLQGLRLSCNRPLFHLLLIAMLPS